MNRSPLGQAKDQLREPGPYELSTGLAPEPRGHMTDFGPRYRMAPIPRRSSLWSKSQSVPIPRRQPA